MRSRALPRRPCRKFSASTIENAGIILLGFGAPLIELARADGARVANAGGEWGRYYDTDPRVFAGFLPDSLQIPGFGAATHDH